MLRIALLASAALVLPLTLLLFAQWPLRDIVQGTERFLVPPLGMR